MINIKTDRRLVISREKTQELLSLFNKALFELTSLKYPKVHYIGRLRQIVIKERSTRTDLRFQFSWLAECQADNNWVKADEDSLRFDDFWRVFLIRFSAPQDPARVLLYIPSGQQLYVLDRFRPTPASLIELESSSDKR